MIARYVVRYLGPSVVMAWGLSASVLPTSFVPSASAQPCPDVEVVFARGTGDPAGVGPVGGAFVDSLHQRVGARSFDVYPVNYPASEEWATGVEGLYDVGNHINSTVANCPATKIVLGGYSQGAAIMGYTTSSAVPDGVDPATVPKPLQPQVADHIAAVVLFGTPNVRAMNFLNEPPIVIGPLYQAKTIKVCAVEDPVCSDGLNFAAHDSYSNDEGIVGQGADFAASRLGASRGASVSVASGSGGFGSCAWIPCCCPAVFEVAAKGLRQLGAVI